MGAYIIFLAIAGAVVGFAIYKTKQANIKTGTELYNDQINQLNKKRVNNGNMYS